MRKIILMSGLAIMIVASFNGNAKAIIVTDKGVNNSANVIANTGVPMVVQDSTALKTVNAFFDKFKSGASPEELASFFDEKAEMFIPGDLKNVPWIGKRVGRAAIAEHFKLLRENIKPEKLEFTDILSKGNRVVILGYLESRMKKNNKVMKSEFSIDIVVENGLLTRYHLLEDSFEVSGKAKL
jgi:uncharacterized protein